MKGSRPGHLLQLIIAFHSLRVQSKSIPDRVDELRIPDLSQALDRESEGKTYSPPVYSFIDECKDTLGIIHRIPVSEQIINLTEAPERYQLP